MELFRPRLEFSVEQQVRPILAEVGLIELVWRAVKMLREPVERQGVESRLRRRRFPLPHRCPDATRAATTHLLSSDSPQCADP
jgi:hypothetical protein